MSILREATLKDLRAFLGMYKDMRLHCLYSPVELQPDVKGVFPLTDEEKRHLIEMEILSEQFLNLYKEYEFKDFEKDLEKNHVFVLERGYDICGYFIISMFEPNVWRIVEWGCNPMTKANRLSMLHHLFKMAKVSKIERVELVSYCSKEFYESQGFVEVNNGFFQKKM